MKAALKEWGWAILLNLAGLAALLFVADRVVLPAYTRHGETIEVPDVVELTLEEARTALAQRGFELVVEGEKFDRHYPVGVIVDQKPEAFATTKPARRIYVSVSSGEPMSTMPNLVGKSERDAVFEASAAGLALSEEDIGYEYSYYYPAGVVMSQSIPPGTKLKKDTPIHITSSLGNLPAQFTIPRVLGLPLERASKIILTSGLAMGAVSYRRRSDLLPNTVLEQDPEPEKAAQKGQPVNLVVSSLEGDASE